MQSTNIIDLSGRLADVDSLSFVRAEIGAEDESPLVTVYYRLGGDLQPAGLRLDVGKKAFIDSTGDESLDERLVAAASDVLSVIAEVSRAVFGSTPSDVSLTRPFEAGGFFSIPTSPNMRLAGRIKFDPKSGIRVQLHGSFSRPFQPPERQSKIILATLDDGSIATLMDTFSSNEHFASSGVQTSEIVVNRVLMGVHVAAPDTLRFSICNIKIDGLYEWLNPNALTSSSSISDEGRSRVAISFEQPESVLIRLDEQDLEIEIFTGVTWKSNVAGRVSLEAQTSLSITSDVEKTVDGWSEICSEVQDLFSLFFGIPAVFDRVDFRRGEVEEAVRPGPNCTFLYVPLLSRSGKELNAFEMPLPWSRLQKRQLTIFGAWFGASNDMRRAVRRFFYGLQRDKSPLEFVFQNSLAALESLSRCSPESSFGRAASGKSDLILQPVLLIKESLERLSESASRRLTGDNPLFAERVQLLWHEIAHDVYGDTSEKASGEELYRVTERLKILFLLGVLTRLGFESDEATGALSNNPQFRWVLDGF